jgi:hypothetical protein
MNDVTSPLSHNECQEFLAAYFEGIMDEGLLQPLVDFSKSNAGRAGIAALSWYDLQVAGQTPQGALPKITPLLPASIAKLVAVGFEKSVLDTVLKDILYAYRDNTSNESVEIAIEKLFGKYSKVNSDVVCAECWNDELSKIIFRSRIESANRVILQQEGEDFLHQKYIGPKLVHVIEASVSAVYKTLEKTLLDHSASGQNLNIEEIAYAVEKKGPSEYLIKSQIDDLNIIFGTFSRS